MLLEINNGTFEFLHQNQECTYIIKGHTKIINCIWEKEKISIKCFCLKLQWHELTTMPQLNYIPQREAKINVWICMDELKIMIFFFRSKNLCQNLLCIICSFFLCYILFTKKNHFQVSNKSTNLNFSNNAGIFNLLKWGEGVGPVSDLHTKKIPH